MSEVRKSRKTRTGVVTSNKMQKTISVEVRRSLRHPLYGKSMKRSKKFVVHDENQEAGIGDLVKISETRPLSKNKRWRLVQIIEKAK